MTVKTAGFIARRYLFARKSHNVINIISAISVVGMSIGTAALIIILSVYNGFDNLVKGMMGSIEPDILITPSKGKVFVPEGECYDWIYSQESVASMCTVLQEQVFVNYDGRQGVAIAKGMDSIGLEESPLRDCIRDGKYEFGHGDIAEAVVGMGLATRMGINPRFLTPLRIYYPSRTRKFSPSNRASSVEYINIWPAGLFSVNSDIDNSYILLDIERMRELLEYTDEVSAVEIRLVQGCNEKEIARIIKGIEERLGEGFRVSDRFHQNEAFYKMMKYEKASIFLILIFVILIIGLNIHACLSMLIIEKREDTATLRAMGADDRLVRRIFVLDGWFIAMLGLVTGLCVGIAFCLLQQHFGIIKMPGNFVVNAYPVVIKAGDILITAACVTVMGYIIAALTERLTALKK